MIEKKRFFGIAIINIEFDALRGTTTSSLLKDFNIPAHYFYAEQTGEFQISRTQKVN